MASPDLATGAVIGERYRLDRRLGDGSGPDGILWLATDTLAAANALLREEVNYGGGLNVMLGGGRKMFFAEGGERRVAGADLVDAGTAVPMMTWGAPLVQRRACPWGSVTWPSVRLVTGSKGTNLATV